MPFIAASGPHVGKVEVVGDLVPTSNPKSVRLKLGNRSVWLPRSQISIEYGDGMRVTVFMPKWLARERGIV